MPRRGENIRKRKDGRWEGRYIKSYTVEGKAKYGSVYSKSYSEIKQKLNDVKNKNFSNLNINSKPSTFIELIFNWLDNQKITLKDSTYIKYYNLINNHMVISFSNIKISAINNTLINNFIIEKSSNGKLDGSGGLSTSIIHTLCYILNASIKYALKEGYIINSNIDIQKPIKQNKQIEILTDEEIILLEKFLLFEIDEFKLGIMLCLYTGLRIGELCGLIWENIDLNNNSILVRHTLQRLQNKNKNNQNKTNLCLSDPKSRSSIRNIPIPSFLIPIIIQKQKPNDCYFLSGTKNKIIEPRTYQYYFKKCLKQAGIRDINFHIIRHTFATKCIKLGFDIKSLSEVLGHANVNITLNRYVHSSYEMKQKQMELLSLNRTQV